MPIIHFYSQCSTLLITGYANPAENNALWQLTASVSSRVYPSRRGVSLQETREVLGKAYPCYLYIPHHDAGPQRVTFTILFFMSYSLRMFVLVFPDKRSRRRKRRQDAIHTLQLLQPPENGDEITESDIRQLT